MGHEFLFIPVPIGLFIFFCGLCFRVARAARRSEGHTRVIIISGPNQASIPQQFESAKSPIITSEDSYEHDEQCGAPPTYEVAHHQLQQQQMLHNQQHPSPHGEHVMKVMQG